MMFRGSWPYLRQRWLERRGESRDKPGSKWAWAYCFSPWLVVLCLSALDCPNGATAAPTPLSASYDPLTSWVRFDTATESDTLVELQATTDLRSWTSIATVHEGLLGYADFSSDATPYRFYRATRQKKPPGHDWKNQILVPEDAFKSQEWEGGRVRWIKFAILLPQANQVVYQHSTLLPFHYEFAVARFPAFHGMTRAQFDQVSLYRTNQQVVLGAVLYPPDPRVREFGIQIVGREAYPVADVLRWLRLVQATVGGEEPARAFYMPTFEQRATAEENRNRFEQAGVEVSSTDRWVDANYCYSSGWALGTLKFITAKDIDAAYAEGRLGPLDILLTDGVPSDTPLVAGIISLTPSTPNSHTAILAGSFGVPFVYLPDPAERARVTTLAGKEVLLSAFSDSGRCEVRVLDLQGTLASSERAELLSLKAPEPLKFAARESYGGYSASASNLMPADIRFFGGKAANFGLLRRSIPTNSPAAIAFSFDLWDAFMAQTMPSGKTLRQDIAEALRPYTNYPPNLPALKTDLAAIRTMIRSRATFSSKLQQAITNALKVFDAGRKIRFRSSTNVEDSDTFTGAGLYDSYSGCLLDDLDDDTAGPSECDPTWSTERGVFRAIQQVYASFYNDNAFLERLHHQVEESKVAMGVLVHHSFPDEIEQANGVATLRFDYSVFSTNMQGDLVTQLGAEPVTNPDGTSIPEVVNVMQFGTFSALSLKHSSSLVPLGATVMDWEADYRGFMKLFFKVGQQFHSAFPQRSTFYLDFEYKKDTNGLWVVKQVRPIPVPDRSQQTTTYLVNVPAEYVVAQEEFGDVFSNHRLKSKWQLSTLNLRLTSEQARNSLYRTGAVEYLEGGLAARLAGSLSSWPLASHGYAPATSLSSDGWQTGQGADARAWRLDTELVTSVAGARPPVVTLTDFRKLVWVTYSKGMPALDYQGDFLLVTQEVVRLTAPQLPDSTSIRRDQTFSLTNRNNGQVLSVRTVFYWPKHPFGVDAGYTAPLLRFEETRISGLLSEPVVLRGYFSQTYRPGHHNFTEEFIFEPRLEPGLPVHLLTELRNANIHLLHVHWLGENNVRCRTLGWDGLFRNL